MRELLRGLLDLVVPRICARCGAGAADMELLCPTCEAELPRTPENACMRCQSETLLAPQRACARCEGQRSPLSACIAAVWFECEIETWIRRFKYPTRGLSGIDPEALAMARALARLAAARVTLAHPDRVVPIPLHRRALCRRGFNPAALLAREIARRVRVPLVARALERVQDTTSQTGLDRAGRRRNVRGAFRARMQQPGRIWLIDDVVTTGATLEAAARALRLAGARDVVAVCAARTPSR
jgi:ComF family protein